MSYRRDKWRQYTGDEPDPGSSEDEAYAAVDAKVAYTRQSVQERLKRWDAIDAFEAYKAAKTTSKVLSAPKHRGLCASVRPEQGAEALVSFVCKPRDGGKSEIGGTRCTVIAGEDHGETWKQVLSREVLDMRRGERIEADIDEELKLDCCLHAVRTSRCLTKDSLYKGQGSVTLKRMEAPKTSQRPLFDWTATIRYVIADNDKDDDDLYKASEGVDPKSVVLGQGDVCEGLEIALLAMRSGEGCIVKCDGEYGDTCYTIRKVGLAEPVRAAVRLDSISEGAEDASYLKERGAMLVGEGGWRRAEACFTRGARCAEAHLKALDEDDDEAYVKGRDVLARCLLNVALCCRKRNGRRDELAVLDGALGVLEGLNAADAEIAAEVEASLPAAALLLRAKARLRRGAAHAALGDADAAAVDLTAADALAAKVAAASPGPAAALRRDVARERRAHAAAAARRRKREADAFKGKALFDEKDTAVREAREADAKDKAKADEALKDEEGCARAQAFAANAPDDETVEIEDYRGI